MEKTIVVASGNEGKIREFRQMFEPEGYKVLCLKDLPDPAEPEETGATFQENAVLKAKAVTDRYGLEAIADDSGLCVAALNGDPGVHSARWMGHETPYTVKNRRLIELLEGASDRSCYYACAIAWTSPGAVPAVFYDTWHGEIAKEPRGTNGFGFDPIFYLPELGITSGEMDPDMKNRCSHRAKALRKLEEWLHETR